jgi:polyhydroxybutyrate depolymerase
MKPFHRWLLGSLVVAGAAGAACAADDASNPGNDAGSSDVATSPDAADGGAIQRDFTRTMAAFPKRSYDVHVPGGYDGTTALPVILNLHGGGGSRASARKLTCPGGDEKSPDCLEPLADARGFFVITPDGTGGPLVPNVRTWNSGGGDGGWQCVSGYACNQDIDEAAYFTALLADVQTVVKIDAKRVYPTGISNGAGMSERLACELPQNVAAFASVAGGNQLSTTKACPPAKPVLEIHGTADPCWLFDGGTASCADTNPGAKIGVPDTIAGWVTRNGCTNTRTTTPLPDSTSDGMTTLHHVYACPAGKEIELYEVTGGGHTWPSGYSYSGTVGPTTTDFSANKVILDFFAAHP